jgi:hypothetical protein
MRKGRLAMARRSSWVRAVRETSNAMDLPTGVFRGSPQRIAPGLRRAVLRSRRTRGSKFQSAMSMLNLYINRGGRTLHRRDRARLEAAKAELRGLFRHPATPRGTAASGRRRRSGSSIHTARARRRAARPA